MQHAPCYAHYALCEHEAGAAILPSMTSFSDSLEQALSRVRQTLLPELKKIEAAVEKNNDLLETIVQRIDIVEKRLDLCIIKKELDSKISEFGRQLQEPNHLVPQGPAL